MEDLIKSYQGSLRNVRHLKEDANDDDKKILSNMESDLRYVLDWLNSGRRPGNRRGIERRAIYQRTIPWDPLWIQSYMNPSSGGSHVKISEYERFQIDEALSTLSERERQCYVLHYGMCFSMSQIASELVVSKGTVQTYVERAEKKIIEMKENSLFLVG